ncbi:MAG: OmpW family outer membrane protein [Verrucomicrobiota bacterium]
MKKIVLALGYLGAGLVPFSYGDSASRPSFYVSYYGGANVYHEWYDEESGASLDSDVGIVTGGEIGYEWQGFSILHGVSLIPAAEVELFYNELNSDISASGLTAESNAEGIVVTANLLFKFDFNQPIRPYLGGGVGFTYTEFEAELGGVTIANGDDEGFAGQGIAGVEYVFDQSWLLYTEYKYLQFETGDSIGQHLIVGGLGFRF